MVLFVRQPRQQLKQRCRASRKLGTRHHRGVWEGGGGVREITPRQLQVLKYLKNPALEIGEDSPNGTPEVRVSREYTGKCDFKAQGISKATLEWIRRSGLVVRECGSHRRSCRTYRLSKNGEKYLNRNTINTHSKLKR